MKDNHAPLGGKVRVGIVNYLNTKPLLYGLQLPPVNATIELIGAYPAMLTTMLKEGQVDLGLIPVASLPELPSYQIVGTHCIAAEGEIASVCLFSEVPMDRIETIYLDYQSRSSVGLLKWLMREYWGISPQLIEARDENFRKEIKGTTAGLVIGDRALEQRKLSTFIYDLGSEWRAITGLPFVFAAWVSTKPLDPAFIAEFDKANAVGLDHIDEIVETAGYELYDLKKYYKLHLSYKLDERKKRGLELFLQYLAEAVV
jgi:chorismate dehydratase